jgi:hypothetical protein
MTMPPRQYSQRSRGSNANANQFGIDELTQMTETKPELSRFGGRPPSSVPRRKTAPRKEKRYDDAESYSESDESSVSVVSEVLDGRTEYSSDGDGDGNEYEEEEHIHRGMNMDAADNRSVYSSGGQSAAAQSLARAINKTKDKGGSRLAIQASLAMQRRKKESPQLRAKLESQQMIDIDYNEGATELYKHIENHRWREAAERSRNEPIETKIWVYRMEKKRKNVLWRMLPLHTAILYRAPVYVILDLIHANSDAINETDYRKMLPIHMACRVICKEDVLRVLLKHKIDTVTAKDAKGRTPRDILQEDKRDQDSKVLKKVADRNRKNLLKVLKEYESIFNRMHSSPSVASSRWSRFGDDRSVSSGMIGDDQSVSSRFSRRSHSNHSNSNSHSRPQSRESRRPHSRESRRPQSRESRRSSSRGRNERDERPNSRESSRGRAERPGSSRSNRSNKGNRERSVSVGRATRGVPRPEESMNKRAPRLPTAPLRGAPPRARSASRGGGRVVEDDNQSVLSRDSRKPRNIEPFDDDDISRFSGRSRVSMAARGYDDDSVAAGSRRSKAVSRVVRKPRGVVEAAEVAEDENPMGISEIKVDEDASDDDVSTDSEALESHDSAEFIDEDLPAGPLYDLWKDIQGLYPIPIEAFDPKLIQENEKKVVAKRKTREEAVSNIKYYDPPKELQKLLIVIESGGEVTSAGASPKNIKKGKNERAPRPEKGAQRRVNALGALKALSKNAKNRLRLVRIRGVISCLLSVLRDGSATAEEKARCSNTLMFLSVPKQNCEAIFHSDHTILTTLLRGMNDPDSRVNYNCCYSLFLLSKSEENRVEIAQSADIFKTLIEMASVDDDDVALDDDDVSVDGSLSQGFGNLGSPSGIRQQGAPATDEETKRGCRLSAIKVFLAVSKSKDSAEKMASNREFMNLMVKIGGKLTAEENVQCMAIFTNLSRNAENMDRLLLTSNLVEAVTRGLSSKNEECRKCSTLTLQNLSCNKIFRRRIGALGISLPGLASQGLNNSGGKIAQESHLSAIHTIRNLAIEPSNVPALMGTPGVTACLMISAADRQNELAQYIASDALGAMSQWLDAIVDTCIERNEIDLKGRTLASMRVSTWNQWD